MKSKPDHHEKNGTVRIYGIKNSFLTNCGFLIILLQIIPPGGMNIYAERQTEEAYVASTIDHSTPAEAAAAGDTSDISTKTIKTIN